MVPFHWCATEIHGEVWHKFKVTRKLNFQKNQNAINIKSIKYLKYYVVNEKKTTYLFIFCFNKSSKY